MASTVSDTGFRWSREEEVGKEEDFGDWWIWGDRSVLGIRSIGMYGGMLMTLLVLHYDRSPTRQTPHP